MFAVFGVNYKAIQLKEHQKGGSLEDIEKRIAKKHSSERQNSKYRRSTATRIPVKQPLNFLLVTMIFQT